MPLTSDELQQSRTPRELLAFVESVRERAKSDEELRIAGHRRTGYLKEYFDEIEPLARFAAAIYHDDHTIHPVLGNQGFDAEVLDAKGCHVEFIEIANPIDGQLRAKTGRELAELGVGGFRVGEPGDDLDELIPIIERTATKKAIKDYSDASVVFNVSALPSFEGFEDRHEEQVTRIRSVLAKAGFHAKRVFVMLPSGKVVQIDGR